MSVSEDSHNSDSDSSESENIPLKKKSKIPMYIVGAVLLIGAILGLVYWLYTRQFVTTDDAFVEANIVHISPKVSAHISKIVVTENQFVRKGDLLVELDSSEFEAKIERAKAELKSALAQREKSLANVALTRKTTKANLDQASSNYDTAKTQINQSKISADSKENNITQAQNQVKTAEANLRQTQSQIPASEAQLAQMKAQLPTVQARLNVVQNDFDRNQTLFRAGDVSKQAFERAQAELSEAKSNYEVSKKQVEIAQSQLNSFQHQVEVAKSRLNEAKTNVRLAENELLQSQSQVDTANSQAKESLGRVQEAQSAPEKIAVENAEVSSADAQISQAEAALKQAELDLSYTKIYAPENGYIAKKSVQEGQLVQVDQSMMAISQSGVWVVANFKETQIGKIKPGQVVLVYVDAYPDLIFNGVVDSTQAGTGSRFSILPPENASGNFIKVVQRIPVKIKLQEGDDKLQLLIPGMSVVPKVKVK